MFIILILGKSEVFLVCPTGENHFVVSQGIGFETV